eukprot:Rhum_TRINITY_DN14894_c1_g1::Rhum_TRINITY_DN14894_c1_g1_i1::g.125998::m.125998
MHRRHLRARGAWQEKVQRLRLVDVLRPRGGLVDEHLLRDLPHRLVQLFEVRGDRRDVLHAAVVGDDALLHLFVPQAERAQLLDEMLVHHGELARHDAPHVDVRRERLEALVVAQDLAGRRRRHRRHEQRVADAVLRNRRAQTVPVVQGVAPPRRLPPQVELQLPLRHRRPGVRLERAGLLRQRAAGRQRGEVDRLEDVLLQLARGRRREREPQQREEVGQALYTEPDGTVPHVALARGADGVVVAVDDAVEVAGHDLHGGAEGVVVEAPALGSRRVGLQELRQGEGREVADSHLVRRRVLDDLRAKVAALDRAEVLLVRLRVARVLVHQVGRARLDLRLDDGEPQVVRLHGADRTTLPLVARVQLLESRSPGVAQPVAQGRVEQRPRAVLVHTLHEQVGHPQAVEEVAGALFVLPRVLLQGEELEDVGVPRLEVDGHRALPLAAALVHVACGRVEETEHREETLRLAVGPLDERALRTHVVHVQPDAAGRLRDVRAGRQRVEDALDRVGLHRHQEARRHLRRGRARVEQRGAGVREVALAEVLVRLDDGVDVVVVDAEADPHQHLLRTLHHAQHAVVLHLQQVALLECLETEVVVHQIFGVVDGLLQAWCVPSSHLVHLLRDERGRLTRLLGLVLVEGRERLQEVVLGVLVQVGGCETAGQQGVVRVVAGKVGGCLGDELTEGACRHLGKHAALDGVCHLVELQVLGAQPCGEGREVPREDAAAVRLAGAIALDDGRHLRGRLPTEGSNEVQIL